MCPECGGEVEMQGASFCGPPGAYCGTCDGYDYPDYGYYPDDTALAEVTVLRKGINALVEQLTEWQCAKDEHKAGIWPALLIQDPEQWCLDALRALLDKGERQGQAWVDTFFDPR
jgi:hypothetical protein